MDRSIDDPGALGSTLSPHPRYAMEVYQVPTPVNSQLTIALTCSRQWHY